MTPNIPIILALCGLVDSHVRDDPRYNRETGPWIEGGVVMRNVTLPNGMEIVGINPYETKFLYDEIFVQELYGSHGIEVGPGDIVMDVGANIGMFALYMQRRFSPRQVFCFEPAPHCFEALTMNLAHLRDDVIISIQPWVTAKERQNSLIIPTIRS